MSSGNALVIAALSGLAGAPHCLIMCGGIASSFAMNAKQSPLKSVLAYNAGRVTTYSLLGGFMGFAGSFMNVAGGLVGIQSIASIVGGILILLWTYWRYTLPIFHHRLPGHSFFTRQIAVVREKYDLAGIYLTGLMLGFLPCGLTYAMQINAAATGSWTEGFLLLLVFGLSTFPILLLTGLFAGGIRKRWKQGMRTAGAVLAYMMGILTLMKGFVANGWVPSIHPWLW
ncbi:sulfite exporter TauE/SafE family protein [Cohnella cholangitidis]|uniref:Sulfite exporter TauE/SafE family protein n=1 Tax=Cohnella cholangitidis TaxID=2598458 RepID=A0A7G5BSH4_9BACL|nr:sulfite exporter TauE/SafE family protein [Cohnella cholangitidis]QMV39908.1 sulfite exporter TauE/SafE family protein [Cohnella cholangitidis]